MPAHRKRRNTPQRITILEQLRARFDHPTAAEIYGTVRTRLPRISLGTVYRNLDVLHEDGLIHKIEHAGSDTRYDGRLEPHDHVRCTSCGAMRDMPGNGTTTAPRPLPAAPVAGFAIDGCRLEYYGLCRDCREHAWPSVQQPVRP